MLAEVLAPFAPELGGLGVALIALCACFVCIGIVGALHGFTRAVVGGLAALVGHVPGVGKVLASPVNAVAHWMEHEFGAAEAYLDKTAAWWMHSLGELWAWLGRTVREDAAILYMLATRMLGPAFERAYERAIAYIHARARWAERVIELDLGRLHRLEVQTRHAVAGWIGAAIVGALRPLEHELGRLEGWVAGRGRAIEHGVDVAIPRELNGLRAWTRELEDEYAALYHRVARIEQATSAEAMTGAVAIALAALGAGWFRCRNVGRVARGMCGLPAGLFEGLLLGAIEAFLVTDICHIAGLIEREAVLFEPLLDEFVNAQAFICLAGGAHYASGIEPGDLRASGKLPSALLAADLAV